MSRDYITNRERWPGGSEPGTGYGDVQMQENIDLLFGDNEELKFGDSTDVLVRWDGTQLEFIPAADDTGAINIGDGTTDIDFKVFLGTTAEYVLFDVGNSRVQFADSVPVVFGDAADAVLQWNGTNLVLTPVTDDTGAFHVGDGTTDMDVIIYQGNTTNYLQSDVGSQKVYLLRTLAGGDSAKGLDIDVDVLAGNSGFRQGAVFIAIDRASGQDFGASWDGNPDCGLKMQANNRAANAAARGSVRGLDIQARNRGTNLSWANAANFNARNDSGSTVASLYGIFIRIEDYGTISTDAIGLDVNMSIENATGSPTRTGIQIRNTDASGQSAVDNVFLVSHTSTNGFTNLFYFNAATGDTVATGDLVPAHAPDGSSIGADAYAVCSINGTPYYIPLYDTLE